ncbi:MAG: carbohydrate-binding protein [Flavisolibacter sp.]
MKHQNLRAMIGKMLMMAGLCAATSSSAFAKSFDKTPFFGKKIYLTKGSDGGIYLNGLSNFTYSPGDTLVVRASQGQFAYISLEEVHGTPSAPVVLINEGGQALVAAISARHCTYMKFTGTGSSDRYGFYMSNPTQTLVAPAFEITGRSSDIEVEKLDINQNGYGFWVKQEASCDPSLQFPNWKINNISLHDNHLANLAQEGFYCGSTGPNADRPVNCNGATIYPTPLRLSNIKIYNNIVDHTGRGGIQLSGADSGNNEIYNNTVTNCGFEYNPVQGSGIILGGYTTAYVHDNTVDYTWNIGIFSLGAGVVRIENNRIDHSGELAGRKINGSSSIMIDTRLTTPVMITSFSVKNNTIGSNTDDVHIRVYNTFPTYAMGNNICNNFTTTGSAALINVAAGVNWYSCTSPVNQAPVANAGNSQTIALPTNSATLTGSGTDMDGTIAAYQWSELTGPSNVTIASASSAQSVVSNLIQGVYTFRLKVTDNAGASATADVNVTVNATGSSSTTALHVEAENWAAMSGVQTETTSDIGGGKNVGGQDLNDWIDYSLNIPSAGTYNMNFRVATMVAGAQFQVKKSDGTVLATVGVPSTGAYQNWQTISSPVTLAAGQQTLRIATVASPGGWNLNWFELSAAGTSSNQLPVANAGADQTIALPASSATLSGSATDANGTIASYQWTELSGPSNAVFSASNSAQTDVTSLVQGVYTFRLSVKDNAGAMNTDDVNVTVNNTTTSTVSMRIEAENWSTMSGVNKETTSDVGGGFDMGSQDLNDWADYSVNVPSSGSYTMNFRVATMVAGAQFQIRKPDGTILSTVSVPSTGTYQTWQTISAQVSLAQGLQTIRIFTTASPAGWNLNWFELVGGSSSTTTTTAAPLHVEAENWNKMSGVQKESTTDAGGGYNVGGQDQNDWEEYALSIPAAGNYTMNFRIATMIAGAQFQVRSTDGTVLATVNVPNTGAYQSWQTISSQLTLPAGQQSLRIVTTASPGGWNLNWFELSQGSVAIAAAASKEVTVISSLEVFPNPVTDHFSLSVDNTLSGTMNVEIIDATGVVKKKYSVIKSSSTTQVYLSAASLPAGQYLLKASIGDWTDTTKLEKL